MKTVFLVSQSEADIARSLERRLLTLSKSAGILFVSIEVIQDPSTKSRRALYKVFVGCDREREKSLVEAVVRRYCSEVEQSQLIVHAHRGLVREST